MKKRNLQSLCLIFLLLFCFVLNSCKTPENIFQSYSEVDFSSPQKVQISFNENIFDAVIALNDSKLEINFINEKNLIGGAYVCLTENSYKITYKDMVFSGDKSQLTTSFFPVIIYDFIFSFEDNILLDTYNNEKECYYLNKNINGYFLTLECYKNNDKNFYSIEIK